MNDWFSWKGVRCTDYGITVLTQPEIYRAAERVTTTQIPGRSGIADCTISDISKLPEINKWLKGQGQVSFANRQGGFFYAHVINQIAYAQVLRGRTNRNFAINFRCQPFFYVSNPANETITASGSFVTNPGNVYSEPVITITGSGDITLMVGLYIVELESIQSAITLDTPLMEAYLGNIGMNSHMSGEFPRLSPGANAISWSGSVSRVVIAPNWRYI